MHVDHTITGIPARSQFNILRQICNFIPKQDFEPWSHVVSLLSAQLSQSISLKDLCHSLQLHSGPLSAVRGATAPSRNGLCHANRERPAEMAEQLLADAGAPQGAIAGLCGRPRRGSSFRFKMLIRVIDSTTIELLANSVDCSKHRRHKAAAKTHLRLNLQSVLPGFVIVDTAAEHDNKRARELCADLKIGEITLFDKGYVGFGHLQDLARRGVSWVTRVKEKMGYDLVQKMPRSKDNRIVRDEIVQVNDAHKTAPAVMRRVVALVEVDSQEQELIFLTNNLNWSPRSIADLAPRLAKQQPSPSQLTDPALQRRNRLTRRPSFAARLLDSKPAPIQSACSHPSRPTLCHPGFVDNHVTPGGSTGPP